MTQEEADELGQDVKDFSAFLAKWKQEIGMTAAVAAIQTAVIEFAAMVVEAQENPAGYTIEQFADVVNRLEDLTAGLLESMGE